VKSRAEPSRGVAAGAIVSQHVNPRHLSYAAGIGFIVIGAWTIYQAG
jgi:putative Ca2+/H+ antiporter (TMEM165/GDT1 family)